MKNNISAILSLVIAVLLLFIFVQNSCSRKESDFTPPKTIPVPEVVVIPELPTLGFKPITETKKTPEYVYVPIKQAPDTTLLNMYKRENDSLKKLLMYSDAVTQRSYETTYEDDKVEIHLYAETTGTLDKLQLPFYKIKESSLVVVPDNPEIRVPKFDILIGTELGVPTHLNTNFVFKGNIFVQNKNMMYHGSFDTDRRAWVGLSIKL